MASKSRKPKKPIIAPGVVGVKCEKNYFEIDNEVYLEVDDDIAILMPEPSGRVHLPLPSSSSKPVKLKRVHAAVPDPTVGCPSCGHQPEESKHSCRSGDSKPGVDPLPETQPKKKVLSSTGKKVKLEKAVKKEPAVKPERVAKVATQPSTPKQEVPLDVSDHLKNIKTEEEGQYSKPESKLAELLSSRKTSEEQELNILLLGTTGVGKSTFINAFANYITYGQLDDAVQDEITCLIPTSFTITDSQYNQVKVEIGESSNEECDDGQSRTQDCRCYEFTCGNLKLRLIDTPGIGDTRGILYDKRNFDNTLFFIGQFEALHGICILLKPNEARLTATFQFCIKQLLSHLATSASRNIVFMFTNARGTFYRPGDTAPTLKCILKDVHENPPNVLIEFSERTTFCLDSEAFRFLIAVRQGIKFKNEEKASFESSWQRSVDECVRLIQHVMNLPPHPIQDTVSINEARKLIYQLSKPLADIVDNIETNLRVLEAHRLDIMGNVESIKDLSSKLAIPVIDIEIQTLGSPRTVCTGSKCRKVYRIGNIQKYHFPVSCHDPCSMVDISGEIVDVPKLRFCDAMDRHGVCRRCGCSYRVHMHIYYNTVEVHRQIADTAIENQIKSKEDAKRFAEFKVQELEKRYSSLKEERDKITSTAAQFAHFLKYNAIAPYNDSFEAYVLHLIENQKTMTQEGCDLSSLEGLENMLKAYREEKAIFDLALNSEVDEPKPTDISLQKIFSLKDDLFNLKLSGSFIRQLHQVQELPRRNAYRSERIVISPTNKSKLNPFKLPKTAALGLQKMMNLVVGKSRP